MEGGECILPSCHLGNCPPSSEAEVALEEVKTAQPEAALAITATDEPAKESELFGVTEINEGSNPEAPQKTVESTANAQASHAEESALLVQHLQTVPPKAGSKDGIKIKLKKFVILASFCFSFTPPPFFLNIGIIVIRPLD